MDFAAFFRALHGCDPFPWQSRLADQVIAHGWPPALVLDLPTGVGKTAALDVAVYHLIRQAIDEIPERTAPLRIFYVVDRRIVVDAAYRRARSIASKLRHPGDPVLEKAAAVLAGRLNTDLPLRAVIMRGGMYRDDAWTQSAAQPTICVSTVDQVGSRLLFSGYGVTPEMRPIHAGLVGTDSLFLVDEAHLSQPFLETLSAVCRYGGPEWAEKPVSRSIHVVQLSATSQGSGTLFQLDATDTGNDLLRRRLHASRPAVIEAPVSVDKDDRHQADSQFAAKVARTAIDLSNSLQVDSPVVGVILNRVRAARLTFDELARRVNSEDGPWADVILLTGRIRPFDRDELLLREDVQNGNGWLRFMEAGRKEIPERPLFVVATQTIEVGADLDFDGLVSEAAPLDALRQRFGRLNRLGERPHAQAVVLIRSTDRAANADDLIYGKALSRTWNWLNRIATKQGRRKVVDLGLEAMDGALSRVESAELLSMLTPRKQAPVMLPAHVDLWCQTNPAPAAVPDVATFLHGKQSGPADVHVVWRADLLWNNITQLESRDKKRCIERLSLIPPTSLEACPVPLNEVRAWLSEAVDVDDTADLEGAPAGDDDRPQAGRMALRWLGPKNSEIVSPADIRPGDTIVVPCSYGGYDRFGWNRSDDRGSAPTDIAEACSRWGRGRRVLRLDPLVVRCWCWPHAAEDDGDERVAMIADQIESLWDEADDRLPIAAELAPLLQSIAEHTAFPAAVRNTASDFLSRPASYRFVDTSGGQWVLIGTERLTIDEILNEVSGSGVQQEIAESVDDDSTTDDEGTFNTAGRITLKEHTDGVERAFHRVSRSLALPNDLDRDLRLAIRWHDLGKIDDRFQKWLFNDEIAWSASDEPLAKSGLGSDDRGTMERARLAAGVPRGFRHEAFSVQLLDRFGESIRSEAHDRDLVRYLIGTHHGHGRPFHPVVADDKPPGILHKFNGLAIELSAEERAAFVPLHHLSANWPDLFWRLIRRYGYWGLAWLESLLRLADQQQSRNERNQPASSPAAVEVAR